MFLILLELAVHFCVAVSSQKSDNAIVIRQPLGPQMCVKLCSTYGGCQSNTFDPVQLRCTLKIMKVKRRSLHDVNLTTEACAPRIRYSRTIHPRLKGLRKVTQILKVSRCKKADKKGVARNKKTDKKGVGRNEKADKKGVARIQNADNRGVGRNEKADKKGVARIQKADKRGVRRNEKADKKGVARIQKADKRGAARNKKADKKDEDVTQKRGPEHTLVSPFTSWKTWYTALDSCKDRGLTLVMPKTKKEVNDLIKYLIRGRRLNFGISNWLGLSNINGNSTFFWVDGTPFIHTNFLFGKQALRSFGTEVGCVMLAWGHALGEDLEDFDWRVKPCDSKFWVVCQN